ncbi:MAG: ATP-binding protein [Bacteroidota bacterium]|jgi:predicted AAA+ superfamily ATPase
MDSLIEAHQRQMSQLDIRFRRTLNIDWNDRLIGVTGARGVGKTTYLLTHIKEQLKNTPHALYASMDDFYFSETGLLQMADEWVKKGGTHLFLDEIHKYENWSQELKNIYDRYKKLKVVFTGSSVLHIQSGNADLSRRAVVYTMEGLSFREYLNIETGMQFEKITMEELVKNHLEICKEIVANVKPLSYFDSYLKHGYYPYYLESTSTYHRKLLNTIHLTLEVDLPYLRHVEVKYIHKLKKLLYVLSQSVPFQPNVSQLAADIEVSRNTVMLYLNYLEESKLLNLLRSKAGSDALLAKPEKVYLHHPNLLHAIGSVALNKGNERETFFYNQVNNACKVHYSPQGDFLVNGKYTFEVGGKSKSKKQIKSVKNSYIAADMLEYGFDTKIPLWLFGFLY